MYIHFSYDKSFEKLMLDLEDTYPKDFVQLNGISDDYLDISKYSQNYFFKKHTADTTIDSNANVQSNHIATYHAERFKAHSKLNSLYVLWKQLRKNHSTNEANRLMELEYCKAVHLHDGHHSYISYCWNFSTYDILNKGLPFITNLPSVPAKHSDTFLQHVIQTCMFAGHQLMGATSIGDVLVVYSYMLQRDSIDGEYWIPNYKENKKGFESYLKQEIQKFIFTLNQPIRNVQSLFTNITIFDTVFLKQLQGLYAFDNKGKMEMFDVEFAMYIQKLVLEFFMEFNRKQLFTFPVLTVQFKLDENREFEDTEFYDYICEKNMEFANLNIFADNNLNSLSSCCRLQSNVSDIIEATKDENTNLIGGSTLKIGSFGVVSINLPRIALESKDKEEFFSILENRIKDVLKINHARRDLIISNIENDQLPLYKVGLIDMVKQYSTVGFSGIYEAVEYMKMNILDEDGKEFAKQVLIKLDTVIKEQIERYKYRINCEQVPGESVSNTFCKADNILFKKDRYFLYSNQFIPLIENTDLINRINLQAEFEKYTSGGSILHCNIGEKINDKEVMKRLISFVVKKGVKYHAINYFFDKCEKGHIVVGNGKKCSVCGAKIVEKYTRIVGFLVPLSAWHHSRRTEFKERKTYKNGQLEMDVKDEKK